MLPWLLPYRRTLALGAVALLFTNLFAAVGPWILKAGIDSLETGTGRPIYHYAFALIAAAAADGVFRFVMRKTIIAVSRHAEYDLRRSLYAHLQRLPLSFFDKYDVGDILARVTNDLNSVRMFLGPGLMYTVNTSLILTFSLALMIRISPSLSLYALLPMPLVTIAVVFVMRYVHQRATRVQEGFATLTTRVRESLTGIRVVKAFHREARQESIFEDASNDYLEANMSLARVQRLFLPAMTLFAGSAIALVLWRGGLLVMSGAISLGDFVAFTGYLGLLMWPMAALGWTVNLFQRGAASWERIEQLLETEVEPLSENGPAPEGSGLLEFDRVSLRRGEREILNDVSVSIAPGSVVAIVGPTGSGKSTLLKLLARLLPPTDGVIRLDGVPLNEWNLPQLRRSLSFVPQEAFLFSESIAKNIELGRPGTEREELLAAAELAALTDEVDTFTDGLDSVVGERGVTLSGGQRQRATLARALVRHPRVLVLDDAFSNMDTKTEERILGRLPHHFQGTTVLLVSHRLSTVRRADRILYLEEGRIAEDGTHEVLLRRGGRYASFVRRQRLLEELESTQSDSGEAA